MKKYILPVLTLIAACGVASAQTEVLKITMNDGTEQTIEVSKIKEMTFEELSVLDQFAGVYTGTQTLTVAGAYNYSTSLTYTLTAAEDGTLTVSIPSYSLEGTMMGDLTLGELTIQGLAYDEEKGGFYRMYANDGLVQHFKAVNGGATVFDNDYALGGESSILITLTEGGIHVENPFKLGAMPLPLAATYDGTRQ
ncbi:MAG: calycin-like domain-containing protein [Muribaculaceae bacterium]